MTREKLLEELAGFFASCPDNFIPADKAPTPADAGQRLYEAPIIAIGSADDPMWEELKKPEAVGPLVKTPKEWMPNAKTVICCFAPFTAYVRNGNKMFKKPGDTTFDVGTGWLFGRVEGQAFLHKVNHFLEDVLKADGHEAFSPYASEAFKTVFAAGTVPGIDPSYSYTSNWSERHAAYICGLGTFGLSKGLITAKGVAGRFGSVITDAELPIDVRPYKGLYDYCLMCGKCAQNCPAGAISLNEGKSHPICQNGVNAASKKYAPRYGCGKCQVDVPCETCIPKRS